MDEPLRKQLRATLNLVPAHAWDAVPSSALTLVNERCADYLGLSKDNPLRTETVTEAAWDSHHPAPPSTHSVPCNDSVPNSAS